MASSTHDDGDSITVEPQAPREIGSRSIVHPWECTQEWKREWWPISSIMMEFVRLEFEARRKLSDAEGDIKILTLVLSRFTGPEHHQQTVAVTATLDRTKSQLVAFQSTLNSAIRARDGAESLCTFFIAKPHPNQLFKTTALPQYGLVFPENLLLLQSMFDAAAEAEEEGLISESADVWVARKCAKLPVVDTSVLQTCLEGMQDEVDSLRRSKGTESSPLGSIGSKLDSVPGEQLDSDDEDYDGTLSAEDHQKDDDSDYVGQSDVDDLSLQRQRSQSYLDLSGIRNNSDFGIYTTGMALSRFSESNRRGGSEVIDHTEGKETEPVTSAREYDLFIISSDYESEDTLINKVLQFHHLQQMPHLEIRPFRLAVAAQGPKRNFRQIARDLQIKVSIALAYWDTWFHPLLKERRYSGSKFPCSLSGCPHATVDYAFSTSQEVYAHMQNNHRCGRPRGSTPIPLKIKKAVISFSSGSLDGIPVSRRQIAAAFDLSVNDIWKILANRDSISKLDDEVGMSKCGCCRLVNTTSLDKSALTFILTNDTRPEAIPSNQKRRLSSDTEGKARLRQRLGSSSLNAPGNDIEAFHNINGLAIDYGWILVTAGLLDRLRFEYRKSNLGQRVSWDDLATSMGLANAQAVTLCLIWETFLLPMEVKSVSQNTTTHKYCSVPGCIHATQYPFLNDEIASHMDTHFRQTMELPLAVKKRIVSFILEAKANKIRVAGRFGIQLAVLDTALQMGEGILKLPEEPNMRPCGCCRIMI